MFQINWKLKALLYKIFAFFNLKKIFYFIQKYITKRSKIDIQIISNLWVSHADNIKKFECKNILEIGAGKSLEQNIYLSYFFNNMINQTTIDINKMLSFRATSYYQPLAKDFSDYRLTLQSQLNIKLNEKIKFYTNFNLAYDSQPPVDVINLSYTMRNGLIYSFNSK